MLVLVGSGVVRRDAGGARRLFQPRWDSSVVRALRPSHDVDPYPRREGARGTGHVRRIGVESAGTANSSPGNESRPRVRSRFGGASADTSRVGGGASDCRCRLGEARLEDHRQVDVPGTAMGDGVFVLPAFEDGPLQRVELSLPGQWNKRKILENVNIVQEPLAVVLGTGGDGG